jgi:hypothetical protein
MTKPLWAATMLLAACAGPRGPADAGPPPPPPDGPAEFGATHHAVVTGTVTAPTGTPLDSVMVMAWRLEGGHGTAANTRVATDPEGRFRLPVSVHAGPGPAFEARVVVRAYGYAARYPRGPGGSVALDSTVVGVALAPLAQAAPVAAGARIVLALP